MTMLTTIPTSATRPFAWRTAIWLARGRRLINGFFAAVIARHARHAARAALHRLDDRQLKDLAMTRTQIDSGWKSWPRCARGCSSRAGIERVGAMPRPAGRPGFNSGRIEIVTDIVRALRHRERSDASFRALVCMDWFARS